MCSRCGYARNLAALTFHHLDPTTKQYTLDLLFEQCDALSMTLLMVTHDHGLLDRFEQVVDVSNLGKNQP